MQIEIDNLNVARLEYEFYYIQITLYYTIINLSGHFYLPPPALITTVTFPSNRNSEDMDIKLLSQIEEYLRLSG